MGFLSTPEMELYGDCVLTFRAKRLDTEATVSELWVALCDNSEGLVDSKTFKLTTEWQNFEFASSAATFNPNNIFQFTPRNTPILLDDVKLVRKRNRIPSPSVNNPINISSTEFIASWAPTPTAEKYLLNVYYKALPEGVEVNKGTLQEGFDAINVKDGGLIDAANPNYPKGWEINLVERTQQMSTAEGTYNSAPQSIVFDAEGDIVITPKMEDAFKRFAFWVKPSSLDDDEESLSLIGVSVLHRETGWEHIANLPAHWMEKDGDFYEFESEDLGDDVIQAKLEMVQKGLVKFYIDDVTIDYETQPIPYYHMKDKQLTDTFCVVKDINPEYDYYYYVKAAEGSLVSAPTERMWVDGLVGMKPVVLPATNVSETGFTASWEKIYNAQIYKVNLYEFAVTKQDNEEVMLLSEEFDLVKTGTPDAPSAPTGYGYSYSLFDEGLTPTEWSGIFPIWADGMVGGKAGGEYSMGGVVFTPGLPLGDGGDIVIDFSALNTKPGDKLAVVIVENTMSGRGIMGYEKEFSATDCEMLKSSVRFEAKYINEYVQPGKDYYVAFMTTAGGAFFLDKVVVKQVRKQKGETTYMPIKLVKTEDTEIAFDQLKKDGDYAYDVQASCVKNYIPYVSEKSDPVRVTMPFSSIENIHADENGMQLSVENGCLVVNLDVASDVYVYNAQGQAVGKVCDAGQTKMSLPNGMYIINNGKKAVKVLVK